MKTPINRHNIPERRLRLIQLPHQPKAGRISVTHLNDSPLIRTLMIEKWDDIQTDYSDYLLRTHGTGWHQYVESFADDDDSAEHKMELKIGDWTLVGVADNYKDGIITDSKFVKAANLNFKETIEKYTWQLNTYAYMHRKRGFPVNKLIIDADIRDWYFRDVVRYNYPKCAYKEIVLDLWDFDKQERFVQGRLDLHTNHAHDECSPKDKWEKVTQYAIMEKGRKKAIAASVPKSGGDKILSIFQAEEIIEAKGLTNDYQNGKIYIEKREGEKTRCENFCDVRSVCPYVKKG